MNRKELGRYWDDTLKKFLNEEVYPLSALPRSEQLDQLEQLFRNAFTYKTETLWGRTPTVQRSERIDRLLDLYDDGNEIDCESDQAYPYHQALLDDIRYGRYPKYPDETNDEQDAELDVSNSYPDDDESQDPNYDAGF